MSIPPIMRIFFALDLPPIQKQQVQAYIQQLKKSMKSQGIRWTMADNLHITLQFLAEVKTQDIELILQSVKESLSTWQQSIAIEIGKLSFFPNPYRPRVIVLDIQPQSILADLSLRIGQGIQKSGYEIEQKPFKAHMTLGRIKQPQGINLSALTQENMPTIPGWAADNIVLFRSEPQEQGSQYTVLARLSYPCTFTIQT